MNHIKLTTLLFLLIGLSVQAQKNASIEIFEGRGNINNPQIILDLSYQDLSSVPLRANQPEIEVLILDNNRIEKLPNWFGNLTNLKILSIKNNNLKEVSTVLSFCRNLEQLYLSGNPNLTYLPPLGNCEQLKIIDVVDTQINDVPGSIRMMDNLFYFKYNRK